MRTEIMIRSYVKDAQWLHYCLRSIRRFASGFGRTVVVYPDREDATMRPICTAYGADALPVPDPGPHLGALAQQVDKCLADVYCPNADVIAHVDSDCVLTAPTTPETYLRDGKPILARRAWADAAGAICWREPTRRALGWEPNWETMCRHPSLYTRGTYGMLRSHVEWTHGRSLRDYVLAQPSNGFSEFNALGNYAAERMPDDYAILTMPQPLPPSNLTQLWSFGAVTPEIRAWMEETIEHGVRRPPPPQ